MDEHVVRQHSNGASAVIAAWRQVVRSQAFVGLFLAVLIVLLAWPRLTGPSWRALGMPFDLRESEGNTVQWEQFRLFDALHATLRSDAGWTIEEGRYNTDHYRALLPTYISAIFAYWLDSSYKGFALVDLLGWWVGAWALYCLARRLNTEHFHALIAAVLLAASPLLISHMWQNAVHVAHSASLVPCFLVALLLLTDEHLALGWRVIGLATTLYIASITYQYHWIIIPCLLALAVVERRRWKWLFSIIISSILFVVITFLTHRILGIAGLSVSTLSNDPLTAVISRLTYTIESGVPGLESLFFSLVELQIRSYHPFIVSLSVLGFFFASTRLRILVLTGTIIGLASSYIHPVSWVIMNGYPFIYISAGLALVQGPRWLADLTVRIGSSWDPQFAARIASASRVLSGVSTVALIILALWSTNADLVGDYGFTQQWWGFTYFLR